MSWGAQNCLGGQKCGFEVPQAQQRSEPGLPPSGVTSLTPGIFYKKVGCNISVLGLEMRRMSHFLPLKEDYKLSPSKLVLY